MRLKKLDEMMCTLSTDVLGIKCRIMFYSMRHLIRFSIFSQEACDKIYFQIFKIYSNLHDYISHVNLVCFLKIKMFVIIYYPDMRWKVVPLCSENVG